MTSVYQTQDAKRFIAGVYTFKKSQYYLLAKHDYAIVLI